MSTSPENLNTDTTPETDGFPAILSVRPYLRTNDSTTYYKLIDDRDVVVAEGIPDLATAHVLSCAHRLSAHAQSLSVPCRRVLFDLMLDVSDSKYTLEDVLNGRTDVRLEEGSVAHTLALILNDVEELRELWGG